MKDLFIGSEPAFFKSAYVSNEGSIDPPQQGISKRFYAACAAIQGLCVGKITSEIKKRRMCGYC